VTPFLLWHARGHVSWLARGRKLRKSLDAFRDVLAIELVPAPAPCSASAARALSVTAAVAIGECLTGVGHDRWLSPEIAAVSDLVRRANCSI